MRLTPHPAPFRISLGERGEAAAWGFLKEKGYQLIEKNYKCKLGEIDVIARRHGRIAFVEVKTRTSAQFGWPQEAVDRKKQEKLFRLAQWYLKEKKIESSQVAFDVVAIVWKEGRAPEMRLIPDAFEKENKGY